MIARLLAFLVPMLITTQAQTTTPFASLVDDYLDRFAQHHPSIAAGNGIHNHDGQLEDFSAAAITAEVTWLRATRSRLNALDVARLTPDERVDHRILQGIVDG